MSLESAHLYHILPESPWPILIGFNMFFFASSLGFSLHDISISGYFMLFSLISLVVCVYIWFNDIVDEATYDGFHTSAVRNGLIWGFRLFIISEIMLFFGFFWAFFNASLCPAIEIGSVYPPMELSVIPTYEFPLFNTFVLIFSGFAVTWTHSAFSLGSFRDAIDSLLLTIFLGFFFIVLQMYEYYEAPFNYDDGVYGCSFYMLTGLHGCHVFVGACFLFVCFLRLLYGHYLTNHYLGLVFAIWYWHFVDGVWIILFILVYAWGNT